MLVESFDLIHLDIWGPFQVPTVEGCRFFLTIIDDCTRVTWVYLLKTKYAVITILPHYYNFILTQYKTKIKAVRFNNAAKLSFQEFFASTGIMSFHSCTETPHQNCVAKRKHQHLLNVARALLFQSNIPLSHWGDCILTAVFLINRTATPVLSNKTPFEVLHGRKPHYNHLKAFGYLCYNNTSFVS